VSENQTHDQICPFSPEINGRIIAITKNESIGDVWVVDKAAWTETINHPAETHTETVHHEEVGHWE